MKRMDKPLIFLIFIQKHALAIKVFSSWYSRILESNLFKATLTFRSMISSAYSEIKHMKVSKSKRLPRIWQTY